MAPLTLLAAEKLISKLIAGDALSEQITSNAAAMGVDLPTIASGQVLLSAATPEMSDENLELSYPRVCVYSSSLKNSQFEKFRAFSGQVSVVAEIWASADLVTQADQWIHFYVESVGGILRTSIGDWGDGMFYAGAYDVQFQAPKAGGLGFVEWAKLTMNLLVSVG